MEASPVTDGPFAERTSALPEESASPPVASSSDGAHSARRPERDPSALEEALRDEPETFGFFQAVRLLERLRPELSPVGGSGDPATEVVRVTVEPTLAFPASEIGSLDLPPGAPARMSVNFMGLTGPLGVLPHEYTLLVARRRRAQDRVLGDFLDLFHHRAVSLFYRAWRRNHIAAARETGEDRVREHALDLVGMGLEADRGLFEFPDEVLVSYAGLLAQQPRGAVALEQLLTDYFGVEVSVEQFVGGWYPVAPADQCPVGEELGASTQLGRGVVVGDEVWDQQMRARVRIGPLTRTQYDRFLPNGNAHGSLTELLRFFSHDQFDWEIQLVLHRDEVPALVLGGDDSPPPLGWSTWIRTRDFAHDPDNTVLRPQAR